MDFMITKLFTTQVVVYVQISLKLPVVFAEIQPTKQKKIKIMHIFGLALDFGFGAYVKVLIGFKAFYFFGFGVYVKWP